MAEKANVFTAEHKSFFNALADLGHFRLLVGWQLGIARHEVTGSNELLEKRGLKNQFGAANCLSVINLFHKGKFVIRAPFGKRVTQGDQILPMVDALERRFNSFLLVWTFEALEKHLQALFGLLLFQLRGKVAIEKNAFHRIKPAERKQEGTPQYFAAYAKYAWRQDFKRVLDELEQLLEWNRILLVAYKGMPWRVFVETIAFCRHRIVHGDGRVSVQSMNQLGTKQKDYVRECLHTSLYTEGEQLLPPTRLIDDFFEAVASYAWALYVLLSDRCKMVNENALF
jgi:hypothetical protein